MKISKLLKTLVVAAVVSCGLSVAVQADAALVPLGGQQVLTQSGNFTGLTSPYSDPKRIDEFLYECTFHEVNYTKAYAFMKKNYAPAGACSAVRNGSFVGHNFDGQYDWVREIVVHTPAEQGRHATVGVAASINLVPDNPIIVPVNGYFKHAPFCILDGMNDAGLVCSLNLVEADFGHTTGTNPGKEELNVYMAPRYLLDYAGSVEEAIKILGEKNVFSGANMELHLMLADAKETAIVEFINNKMVVKKGATIMTNFFNTQEAPGAHAKGVERFDILKENYAQGNSKAGMIELMDKVKYTRLYDRTNAKPWYSEFNSIAKGVDMSTPKEKLAELLEEHTKIHENRLRTYDCWITKHMSLYDMANKKLTVISQENGVQYDFGIEQINYIPGK